MRPLALASKEEDRKLKDNRRHKTLAASMFSIAATSLTACSAINTGTQISHSQQDGGTACLGDQSKSAKRRSIGIVPQFNAKTIWDQWKPLLGVVGREANICFLIKTEASIPDFEEQIKKGRYDYVYMNPFHQALTKEHYEPIIRNGSSRLSGVIVAGKEATITTLEEAEGKKLYLPAPNAFGASILTRQLVRKNGINVIPTYVRTHTNVYLAVANDKDAIGGMILSTLQREDQRFAKGVKILTQTEEHTPHPISSHKSIRKDEQMKVQSAFVALSKYPDLQKSLKAAQISKPVPANYPKDYKHLEQ